MRKIGAIMGIAALAALVSSHLPAGAFSIHLGRFYFHLPLAGHHRHHPMRTNRNEARPRPNESGGDSTAARGRDATEQDDRETRAKLTVVGSVRAAMTHLDREIPNLVLVGPLMPLHEETQLVARLRDVPPPSPLILMLPSLLAPQN